MASPEELILEQRTRALNLKEDSLLRQAEQQALTEKRLNQHQKEVAERERANRYKAQELTQREQKLEQQQQLQEQEALSLAKRQQELAIKQRKNQFYLVPILLVICIAGGYFAFDYLEQQKAQFNQIAQASKNIDKLAAILNMTQEQVIDKSNDLQSKKQELDKTKTMLVDLKTASDQLQAEITRIQENPLTEGSIKASLNLSAESLAAQLANLRTQLEDTYLTIDINEAFIDHQEHDLKTFKAALADYKSKLAKQEGSLTAQQAKQASLESLLASSQAQNDRLSAQLNEMNQSLKSIQSQLAESLIENKQLAKENALLNQQSSSGKPL